MVVMLLVMVVVAIILLALGLVMGDPDSLDLHSCRPRPHGEDEAMRSGHSLLGAIQKDRRGASMLSLLSMRRMLVVLDLNSKSGCGG